MRRDSRSWVTAAAAMWKCSPAAAATWEGFLAVTAARWRNWECGGDEQGQLPGLECLLCLFSDPG